MKIEKIKVENFRSLKDFEIDIESDMSLIVGKNNVGKTSLLEILNKFLNRENRNLITAEDFNIKSIKEFENITNDEIPEDLGSKGIKLKIFIKYNEEDSLENISNFLMTLDVENNYIVLDFEYIANTENIKKMKLDFIQFKEKSSDKNFEYFFKHNYYKYFNYLIKSLSYNIQEKKEDESNYINIENIKDIKKLLNLKCISARRLADNKESNRTLSNQSANYYEKIRKMQLIDEKGTLSDTKNDIENSINKFRNELEKTDEIFNAQYHDIFKSITDDIQVFGALPKDNMSMKIKSQLQETNILSKNTNVYYNYNNEGSLPENYNGLGYLNLMSIIFEIENIVLDFFYEKSDINLLFIEEPEAHTHPQMQYIFIKNINDFLKKLSKKNDLNLQSIITTHSSHIISQDEFENIKYFIKNKEGTKCKNLKDLEKEYKNDENETYKFLKQYLTLNCSEIFFADKVIFIEGATERILLLAMMKKIDEKEESNEKKLLSQNISIIEIGRHSKLFEKFIDFLQIKTLIITDIDFVKLEEKEKNKTYIACKAEEAISTSNDSLKFFFNIEGNNCIDE